VYQNPVSIEIRALIAGDSTMPDFSTQIYYLSVKINKYPDYSVKWFTCCSVFYPGPALLKSCRSWFLVILLVSLSWLDFFPDMMSRPVCHPDRVDGSRCWRLDRVWQGNSVPGGEICGEWGLFFFKFRSCYQRSGEPFMQQQLLMLMDVSGIVLMLHIFLQFINW